MLHLITETIHIHYPIASILYTTSAIEKLSPNLSPVNLVNPYFFTYPNVTFWHCGKYPSAKTNVAGSVPHTCGMAAVT